jgi:hypothetical protein
MPVASNLSLNQFGMVRRHHAIMVHTAGYGYFENILQGARHALASFDSTRAGSRFKNFGKPPGPTVPGDRRTLFGTQRRNHHARLMRFEGVDGGLVKGLVIQPTPLDAVDAPVFAAGAAPRSFVATPPTLGCLRIRSTRPCVRMSQDFFLDTAVVAWEG